LCFKLIPFESPSRRHHFGRRIFVYDRSKLSGENLGRLFQSKPYNHRVFQGINGYEFNRSTNMRITRNPDGTDVIHVPVSSGDLYIMESEGFLILSGRASIVKSQTGTITKLVIKQEI